MPSLEGLLEELLEELERETKLVKAREDLLWEKLGKILDIHRGIRRLEAGDRPSSVLEPPSE